MWTFYSLPVDQEKHVLEVRLQQAETTNNELKEHLDSKLAKATENRDNLLKEIQEKQHEHVSLP